jgi:SAM-dependent methyltransferase
MTANHELRIDFADPSHCPICEAPFTKNGEAFVKTLSVDDINTNLGTFEIWRCATCAVGLTAPRPTSETIPLLYSSQGTPDFDLVSGSVIDRIKDVLAEASIRSLVSGRRIESCLDFGAGNGRFAYALRRVNRDATVTAVDFADNPPAPERSYFGRGLRYLKYSKFVLSNSKFDIIFCRHVLEHTEDPRAVVRDLLQRLTPGGVMYVEVPNLDSAVARFARRLHPYYYVPRHLVHFTPSSLRKTLTNAGYEVEVRGSNPPMMGNLLANFFKGSHSDLKFQLMGIPLYAVQLAIEALGRSSTCLSATIRKNLMEAPSVSAL